MAEESCVSVSAEMCQCVCGPRRNVSNDCEANDLSLFIMAIFGAADSVTVGVFNLLSYSPYVFTNLISIMSNQ